MLNSHCMISACNWIWITPLKIELTSQINNSLSLWITLLVHLRLQLIIVPSNHPSSYWPSSTLLNRWPNYNHYTPYIYWEKSVVISSNYKVSEVNHIFSFCVVDLLDFGYHIPFLSKTLFLPSFTETLLLDLIYTLPIIFSKSSLPVIYPINSHCLF